MRSLQEALESFPRTVQRPGIPLCCQECRHVRHHECAGHPPCNCGQCWGGTILAEGKRAYEGSNSTQVLRAALGSALALAVQRQRRRELAYAAEPVRVTSCACGCGAAVTSSRFGRRRLYVSPTHRQRVFRRQRARTAA